MESKEDLYGQEWEDKQREADHELEFESDDDDEENNEPDYYMCHGCMKDYGKKPFGGMCDNCGAYVEEGFY